MASFLIESDRTVLDSHRTLSLYRRAEGKMMKEENKSPRKRDFIS